MLCISKVSKFLELENGDKVEEPLKSKILQDCVEQATNVIDHHCNIHEKCSKVVNFYLFTITLKKYFKYRNFVLGCS